MNRELSPAISVYVAPLGAYSLRCLRCLEGTAGGSDRLCPKGRALPFQHCPKGRDVAVQHRRCVFYFRPLDIRCSALDVLEFAEGVVGDGDRGVVAESCQVLHEDVDVLVGAAPWVVRGVQALVGVVFGFDRVLLAGWA